MRHARLPLLIPTIPKPSKRIPSAPTTRLPQARPDGC
jgi:hypothetical protein